MGVGEGAKVSKYGESGRWGTRSAERDWKNESRKAGGCEVKWEMGELFP